MKIFTVIVVFLFSTLFPSKDITDDIVNALKQGNTQALISNFGDKVSVKILNQEDLLSKSQSQSLIEDFFNKHKVKNFQTAHSSFMNGQQFITGNLECNDGKYRVSVLLRGNVISQFRIENDNE